MTRTNADIKILKVMNRFARYFYKWSIHEKLPTVLEYPKETFIDYGSKTMNNYIKTGNFLDMNTNEFDCFLVSCEMLRRENKLKDAIIELYCVYRKEPVTQEDIEEFKEILKNER